VALERFSPAVRTWFTTTFGEPTPAQAAAWPAIADGEHTLVLAPTGSGKTLAAFLWAIDRLSAEPAADRRTRVVYVSPLRALAVDVDKNLRGPIRGVVLAAERLGEPCTEPTIAIRTGDTPADERRRLLRHPPDVLITTPESLYLMLTSQARETLRGVETVIVDEIHALAGTKRGAHLALTLERLAALTDRPPQRIGLSATQRPLDEIGRFLGGHDGERWRPVRLVDAGVRKELDIEVVVPVDDMGALGELIDEPVAGPAAGGPQRRSIWPAVHPVLLDLVEAHRSTIVFVNARRLAERLASRLNELATERLDDPDAPPVELVKAHHGSLSRERRLQIEDELKRGTLRGLVATSSLELGIDMGAVDLVVQVESPGAVSRGLQRIGRAGHQVGEPSRGKVLPKHRIDLLEAAVVVRRMHEGLIEETRYPRNPLDVLAQQIVAMVAVDDWSVADLSALVRRAANFQELPDEVLASVLDMLAGRYPAEEFAELKPRLVWDRVADVLRARPGAQRLAVTNGGTIPDRGLFGVFLPDGTRVGELDEEMVYESRPGETFLLGASTWRIEDITFDRVVVTPAPGQGGKMPFWHGDGPGRPLELGRAMGRFVREIAADDDPLTTLRRDYLLDERAAANVVQFIEEQRDATGVLPDDRTVVVERFRDEIGDWRVCILSSLGARVHAPWGMALQQRLEDRWGVEVEMIWSDDGIVIRLPEAVDELPVDDLRIEPEDIDRLVVDRLPGTAMFASRFRECAGRALLLPRRRPDRRTPLWQQRQRAADLLGVASRHPTFPILLEATRECVSDVFDLAALREVLADLRSRRLRLVPVETDAASPFAQSLLFGWIAVYMYEGDAPLAERRAAALTLDRELLRSLLGDEELRSLLDPDVLADLELELQRLTPGRQARGVDEVHDLLRVLGPLTDLDVAVRCAEGVDAASAVDELLRARRVIRLGLPVGERLVAAEDASRFRDALGVALPPGLPAAYTEPVDDPLGDLVVRYARTHGPFTPDELAGWIGVPLPRLTAVLDRLEVDGRLLRGGFRPRGHGTEHTDPDVLRQLRRRSLAALRREVAPVPAAVLGRFLPAWQGVGGGRRGTDAVADAVALLQGAAIPASVLERDVLAARVAGYRGGQLDELCTGGELVWVGAGAIGASDGRVRLFFRDQVGLLASPGVDPPEGPHHDALRSHLGARGASFWPELVAAVAAAGLPYDEPVVLAALWDLVWAGEVTNDSLAPVRAFVGGTAPSTRRAATRRPRPGARKAVGPPAAAGRWSLVAPLLEPRPSATESAHARALQLVERYGVLTRESALGEGVEGGFAGVYPVLKALEERGRIRRGYFVEGLGAAQFAEAGAVDRLRDLAAAQDRDGSADDDLVVLAATDPAQPYGAALRWPASAGRPSRSAGAYVVLAEGRPLVLLERGGRSLVTFEGADTDLRWAEALCTLVKDGRLRQLELTKVDGEPAGASSLAPALEGAGFVRGYRGLRYRA
jgi:ATP-dependent Lhr-like helicase